MTPAPRVLGLVRAVALIAIVIGAAGTIVMMLRVGHRSPFFLMVLFMIWDLSPFVALVAADVAARGWPPVSRAILYVVTLVVSVGSLALYYSVAFGPPRTQPAARFLMVPLGAWVLMAIAVPIAARMSRPRVVI